MASGQFNISTSNQYISGYVSWSESNENITNNTTDVTATMYLHRTNTGYTSTGTDTFHVSINGADHANTISYSLTSNGYTQMVTGTTTVTHNSDGTKSITIGWSGGGGGGGVFTVNSGSGTATLMTIPRASTVSSSISWTAGTQNLPITLNVADSSFHHSIQVFVGDTSNPVVYGSAIGQRDNIGSSTTWVFTQAENTTTYQKISGYENRPVIVRVFTYDSGGNQIGSYQDATGTVYAVATATATIGTGNSFNISDLPTLTYSLNNYTTGSAGGFTYDLVFTLGSFSKTFSALTAQTGTIGFTSTDVTNMYNATPNSNTLTGTVDVRTKYNGVSTEDGIPATHTTNITANVTNSNPTFGTGYSYTDTNTTTSGITGDASYIIQNNSTVQVTLPTTAFATPINGATMTGGSAIYTFVLNGVTKTATQSGSNIVLSFGTVNASTNQTLTVTATDSRGNSTTTSMTVKVLPYQAPIVTTTASRVNGFETTINLTLSGSISSLTTTAQKNALTSISGEPAPLEYCYAENITGSTFSAWTAFTYTTSGATYSATTVSIDLDNTKSYIFQVRATDKLQTSTQSVIVASGQPILFMDFDLNSVGVGKFPTGTGTFETNSDAIIGGNLQVNNKAYVTEKVSSIPATANWYRIATSPSGIANVMGTFEIQSAQSSHHSYTKLIAGINYGDSDLSLTQLAHSNYGSPTSSAITQARVVYDTTYSGNYAYLEVYNPNATAFSMTVRLIGGSGWSLITAVAGSVPTGYTSKSITLNSSGIAVVGDIRFHDLTDSSATAIHTPISRNSSDGSAIHVTDGDWNTFTTTGIYRVNSDTNAPPKSSSNPDKWRYLQVIKHTDGWIYQLAMDYRDGFYHRRYWGGADVGGSGGTWDAWRKVQDDRKALLQCSGSGQSLAPNTWTRATWNTPTINENFIWQPSGNVNMFGVPENGYYEVTYGIQINQSVNTGFSAQIWGNASPTGIFGYDTTNNGWNWLYATTFVYLNVGTNYEIVIQQSDGGYTRTVQSHTVTVKRI